MKDIVAFIDAPDPDNFVMLIALARRHPEARLHVVLTGRPLKFDADRSHETWQWDVKSSRMAQEASALRIKNFLKHFGIDIVRVYDGGIAPRTLVPHWIHFQEYYRFLDADPLRALRHSELDPQEDLVHLILHEMDQGFSAVVGGPMTGLAQLIVRNPEVATRVNEVHAMFATWGHVDLMDLGGEPRGAKQFNVACDPQAAYQILMVLTCPIYLMPTEVTRVQAIGFQNTQALRTVLPQNDGTDALLHLYALWYDAAVRPRQASNPEELIFIHDLVGAFSLDQDLRESIYRVGPITITSVPHLPAEAEEWGTVLMGQGTRACCEPGPRYAATSLEPEGASHYIAELQRIFE